jgi:hypothetical protein
MILHLASALALVAAHGTFLGRGLYLRRAGRGPAALDRAARILAQLLLPLTALLGLLEWRARGAGELLPHLLLGLSPLAAILLVNAGRLVLRRRTAAPWLLPAVNLALIAAAMLSGFLTASAPGL